MTTPASPKETPISPAVQKSLDVEGTFNEHALKFILPSRQLEALAQDVPVVYTKKDAMMTASSVMAQRVTARQGVVSAQFGFDEARQSDYVIITKTPEKNWTDLSRDVTVAIQSALGSAPVKLDVLAQERERAAEIAKKTNISADQADLEDYMKLVVQDAYKKTVAQHNGTLEFAGYNPERKALLVRFSGTCTSCNGLETFSLRSLSRYFKAIEDLKPYVENVVDVASDPHADIYMGTKPSMFRVVPPVDVALMGGAQRSAFATATEKPQSPVAIQSTTYLQQAIAGSYKASPEAVYQRAGTGTNDGYVVDFWDHPSKDPAKAIAFLYDEKNHAPENGHSVAPHIFIGSGADVVFGYNMNCDTDFNAARIDGTSGYKMFREAAGNFSCYIDRLDLGGLKKGAAVVTASPEQLLELRLHVLNIPHQCAPVGPGLRYKGQSADQQPSKPRFEAKPV